MKTKANEIVITRLIDAPLERVWRAWADPEEVAQWWGPNGFSDKTVERSFEPGGTWRHTMIGPDGVEYPNVAKFKEIVPHEKIVYTIGGGRRDQKGVHFTATVLFKAAGKKTEITLRSVFDSPAEAEYVIKNFRAVEGGHQTLNKLEVFVKKDFIISRLFQAPRERVWKAWTDAKELPQWMGPHGSKTFHSKLDFRAGGTHHYGMRVGGVEMWGMLTYKEIVAPEKLVYLQAFSDKDGGPGRHPMAPNWPPKMLTVVTFQDFGPSTLVTVQWTPFEATAEEIAVFQDNLPGMRGGWTGAFVRLDELLAKA